jgi:D-alanyl-D-alanine carboxypeptidase
MTSSQHRSPAVRRGRKRAVWGAMLSCSMAAAVIAASALATPKTATNTEAAGLQKDVDALVAAGAPGVILFVRNGNRTVRFTAGLGNVARKTPMRPNDHFKIASLTKSYTAAVVLQLVGEGKLGLGDSVNRRLPGLVPHGDKITIRQLLNHTSGLADFEANPRYLKPYLSGNFGYYWAPRQLVKMGVSQNPLFAPGTRYSYSNTNYVIAQLILEKVTGKTIGAELTRRIFRPLHLGDTSYPTKPGLPSPYAHGYKLLGKPPAVDVTGVSPSLAPGSGAIISTALDVADFYRALLSGKLLKPEQMTAMKTVVSVRTGKVVASGPGEGLGVGRQPYSCGGGGWGRGGELPGYEVFGISSADGRRQTVLMMNQDHSTVAKRAVALFDKLSEKAYCRGA